VDGTADGELEGAAVVAALGAVNGVALEDVGSAGRCDTDDAASSGGDAADDIALGAADGGRAR
jgi:hypothetical protein